jgi:hypothetical protein
MNIPAGYVAVRSISGRVLFHLMAEGPDGPQRTLCGRYSVNRILPEDAEVPDGTRLCRVDQAIAAKLPGTAPGARSAVACDQDCGALDVPITLDEFKTALAHWRDHSLYGGCSHGGT